MRHRSRCPGRLEAPRLPLTHQKALLRGQGGGGRGGGAARAGGCRGRLRRSEPENPKKAAAAGALGVLGGERGRLAATGVTCGAGWRTPRCREEAVPWLQHWPRRRPRSRGPTPPFKTLGLSVGRDCASIQGLDALIPCLSLSTRPSPREAALVLRTPRAGSRPGLSSFLSLPANHKPP